MTPDLCDLITFLDISMKNLLNTISTTDLNDINAHHECIYRQIYKIIKSEIADKLYELSKIHSKMFLKFIKYSNPDMKLNLLQKITLETNPEKIEEDYNKILGDIRTLFVERLEPRDRKFGEVFSKTQLFINYISDLY